MLEVTISGMLSFVTLSTLLVIYTLLDLRDQRISNRLILAGFIIGFAVVIISGHLVQNPVLHLASALFMMVLGYTLFRLGSFGGADVKIILMVSIVSPGLEFISWGSPIFEATLVAGLQLGSMLIGGYLYSRTKRNENNKRVIPLIPLLLGAYLVLQLFALF